MGAPLHLFSHAPNRSDGCLLLPDPSDDDMENRRIPPELCFLKILEMDLDGDSGDSKLAASFDEAATACPWITQRQPHVADPEGTTRKYAGRAPNSITIHVEHGVREKEKYREYLTKDIFGDEIYQKRLSVGGYEGLSNQWKKIPESWFEVLSFAYTEAKSMFEFYGSRDFASRFGKIAKEFCVLAHEDGSLTLLISIRTYSDLKEADSQAWLMDTVRDLVTKFKRLDDIYHSLLKKTKKTRDRKTIMMLWFTNAQLLYMLDVLRKARRSYQKLRRDTLEARNTRLLPNVVNDIITDAYLHRELQNRADNFTFVLESFLDTAIDTFKDEDFKSVSANVRGLSSDLRRLAEETPKSLEHGVKLLEIRQNVQDSPAQHVNTDSETSIIFSTTFVVSSSFFSQ